ncbi:MAG: hypothetical protein LUG18_04355 [Candidatus Azobacteroides sp.]|nr:hypothetical protein [Candidatus Azobacteroides sp.]
MKKAYNRKKLPVTGSQKRCMFPISFGNPETEEKNNDRSTRKSAFDPF